MQGRQDWQSLAKLIGSSEVVIERVRVIDSAAGDLAIEGKFQLPPLARLAPDDQIFVAAFVRSHGSIKQMEQFFGVSYPTVKNRLNRISSQLPLIEVEPEAPADLPETGELLTRLERGETSVRDVLSALRSRSGGRST